MTRVLLYIESQKHHHADGSLWPTCEPPIKPSCPNSDAREGGELPF